MRLKDAEHDREVVAAITAGDPAGIAMAYDAHAPDLYSYCHWMLHDSADAAESLQDTFVLAAATLSELPEPSKLRPWLFALARNECRRRIRPRPLTRDEADAANPRADEVSRPTDAADRLTDATMPFRGVGELDDATMSFRMVSGPGDATMSFRMVGEPGDATMPFRMVGEPGDATMSFRMVGGPGDATMPFRVLSGSVDATDSLADVNGHLGKAELRELIRSILADMKPREREVIELGFRHDLHDNGLAIALGLSQNRANALASRTRGRLEESFGALRTALAGRQACPVMGELLADWDGQLTQQTHDLVVWHIEQCQTCVNRARGTPRPTVLSGLPPSAPLPPELREKVLSRCSSTSEDAVTYRRRVVRRAESTWAAASAQAIRWLSWDSIRAYPGAAIATTAVAVWVMAAVSVTLLTFAGSHAAYARATNTTGSRLAHALTAEASAGTSSRSRAAAQATATASRSVAARPSPTVTQPSAYVSSQVQSPPSPRASKSPSRSPSPKPSSSRSPSPSRSPSSSPSQATSPSSSPSPTA